MISERVQLSEQQIAEFCQRHRIQRLALFGSVLRDDFDAESDVDMLVEFETDTRVGLLDMAMMEIELSEMIGRKVDFRTPAELSRYFRQDVLDSARVIYG